MHERLPQPMQPIITDESGLECFQANALIKHLLDHSGIDLSDLAMIDAPQEDREQFAQLIGYSVRGFCGLAYVRPEIARAAERMTRSPRTITGDYAARIEAESALKTLRLALRQPMAELFDKHPDDLMEVDE